MRRQAGFSYLWVMLLVAMLGLSWAMASDIYTTSSQRDKEQELLAIGRQFRVAIASYNESLSFGKREYPASLEDLLHDKRMSGGRRHLRRIFVDPMTGKPEWGLVRMAGRIVGVYSLSEKQPIKQANFEAEDAAFAGKQKYSEWIFTYPSDLMQRGAPGGTSTPAGGPAASAPPSLFAPIASAPEGKLP